MEGLQGSLHLINFLEKVTKAQRGAMTCPSSHRVELRKLTWVLVCKSYPLLGPSTPWASVGCSSLSTAELLGASERMRVRKGDDGKRGQSREVGLLTPSMGTQDRV